MVEKLVGLRRASGSKFDEKLSIIDQNEVSEPFKTDLGWHIIQYTDFKFEDLATENIDNKIKFDLNQ